MSSETAMMQLRRLLHLVPRIADGEEHSIDGLAEQEGVDVSTLNRMFIALASRTDDPAGFMEGVQIYMEGGNVSLFTSHFLRPMRLTVREMAALDLGLAMLAGERPVAEQSILQQARERLGEMMTAEPMERPTDTTFHADVGANADSGHLAALRKARSDRHRVEIAYLKDGTDVVEARVVHPYAVLAASGHWYLIAHCERSAARRIFRVDRVRSVTQAAGAFEIPADFTIDDVLANGIPFVAAEYQPLRVRYSPRIARWIAERFEYTEDEDGSVVVEYPMADAAWAVRRVLQYGPDAEVLSPATVREEVARRLRQMIPGA